MYTSESPFYLAVNYHHLNDNIWYKKLMMGNDRISTIMKRMAATVGLSGKKTNHSVRKVMVTCLTKHNINTRNSNYSINWTQKYASLNNYKKASPE